MCLRIETCLCKCVYHASIWKCTVYMYVCMYMCIYTCIYKNIWSTSTTYIFFFFHNLVYVFLLSFNIF